MMFWRKFFRKEDRSLTAPEKWFIDFWSGGTAASGVHVDEETSLRYSAVFAAVRILAESVAALPLFVYRRLPRGKEKAVDHPLYNLLHLQPNPEITSFTFREVMMAHLSLWGNAYTEIERDGGGRVKALWPLPPNRVFPERDPVTTKIRYRVSLPDRNVVFLPSENVLHVVGLSLNGLVGVSPIRMAREAIGLGLAAEEYGARFFANDASPGGVLEYPGRLSQEAVERIRKTWEMMFSGLSKKHRIALLEEGMKFHQISIPPEDAQFLQTRKFQVTEIARIFRIPPHMLADLDRATFSNIEHQSIEFVVHTLTPWLVRIEQAINTKLFTPSEKDVFFAEFQVNGLLRGDIKSRFDAYAVGRQWGWLSVNDIRELENMNPVDGGDVYLMPLNMVPVSGTGSQDGGTGEKGEKSFPAVVEKRSEDREDAVTIRRRVVASYFPVFEAVLRRVFRREKADIIREAEKVFGRRNVEASVFLDWLVKEFYPQHRDFIIENLMPVLIAIADGTLTVVGGEINRELTVTPEIEEFLKKYGEGFADRHIALSVALIRDVIDEAIAGQEDPVSKLRCEISGWEEKRAKKVAEDEAVRFSNAVALTAYVLAGVVFVRWVAGVDACPFCRQLNGKIVGVNTFFLKPGDKLLAATGETDDTGELVFKEMTKQKAVKHPPLHSGCRCVVVAGIG